MRVYNPGGTAPIAHGEVVHVAVSGDPDGGVRVTTACAAPLGKMNPV